MTAPCASEWFAGLTGDHLYADCPNRHRGEVALRRAGWWDRGTATCEWASVVDPHGGDICGLCLHRRNRVEHGKTRRNQ